MRLLTAHNPSAGAPSTGALEAVFTALEAARIARTAELVRKARVQGENRVAQGVRACRARNDAVRAMFHGEEAALEGFADVFSQPFVGESEI